MAHGTQIREKMAALTPRAEAKNQALTLETQARSQGCIVLKGEHFINDMYLLGMI